MTKAIIGATFLNQNGTSVAHKLSLKDIITPLLKHLTQYHLHVDVKHSLHTYLQNHYELWPLIHISIVTSQHSY
jgi:dsRNA-specific ribonuclease